MSALAALFANFQAALLVEECGASQLRREIVQGPGLDACSRVGIYRNAYRIRLKEALSTAFARTHAYIGDAVFHDLAMAYIALTPSSESSLRWYGADFPAFLARELPGHPAVAELAEFEWALALAFDAEDARSLTADGLQGISEQGWDGVGFLLHPSAQLLTFEWNAPAIWLALDRGEAPPEAMRAAVPVTWLIWRRDLQPHFRSLDLHEADALRELAQGDTFAAVSERLAARYTDQEVLHEITAWLYGWLQDGLLAAIRFNCGPQRL
ncbi:HvfC/BufC N-terminal domain-containing protein [Massilia endophytica]|uniref:HvfC/BufC N-terminal domain-containing protein n=1 Tax=Massilia endophytica TaxID=2899220 RepID=UPI001E2E3E7A|nr:DNA-binding domain-containing protein [Massilia endophytica]UGQ46985.1 DNA-binding domain-containing protein [Massilia endophytica]